jgi:hypothetical protein
MPFGAASARPGADVLYCSSVRLPPAGGMPLDTKGPPEETTLELRCADGARRHGGTSTAAAFERRVYVSWPPSAHRV